MSEGPDMNLRLAERKPKLTTGPAKHLTVLMILVLIAVAANIVLVLTRSSLITQPSKNNRLAAEHQKKLAL